jgi:hypothetical protein
MTEAQHPAKVALDCLLADWYVSSVLKKGSIQDTIDRFEEEAGVHPELRRLAEERLSSLAGIEDQRCFISKVHRDYLKRVLNGKNSSDGGGS